MSTLDERIAKVEATVEYISDAVRNHIPSALREISNKLDNICPAVKENTYWVGRIKQGMYWVSIVGFGGGILSLIFYLARRQLGAE